MEESAPDAKISSETKVNGEVPQDISGGEPKTEDLPRDNHVQINSEATNEDLSSNKKRKPDASVRDGTHKNSRHDSSDEADNGEIIQMEVENTEDTKRKSKISKHDVVKEDEAECVPTKENNMRKIKWKKLIKAALKSVCLLIRDSFYFNPLSLYWKL